MACVARLAACASLAAGCGPGGDPAVPPARPAPEPSASSGPTPDDDRARAELLEVVDRAERTFLAACRDRPRNTPELCACAWQTRLGTFTLTELAGGEADDDPDKRERFLGRVGSACAAPAPEGPVRERLTAICTRGRASAEPYCHCRYESLKASLGVDALADPATPTTAAYRDARSAAVARCGPSLPASAVHDPFLRDCVRGGGSLRVCDCLWATLLKSASPAAVDEGELPAALAVRAERTCAGKP